VRTASGRDWLEVTGGRVKGGGKVLTQLDHRIAMSFLVMGLAADSSIAVDDGSMIATSFPSFRQVMNEMGGAVEPFEEVP
jgi:3-phosphoshikimate 1-carboxyvinyltransferase